VIIARDRCARARIVSPIAATRVHRSRRAYRFSRR
jgi:hypothetical protein